jgi:VanZ family protein
MWSWVARWSPVIAWSVMIFLFSTDEFSSAETLAMIHRLIGWAWPGAAPEMSDAVNQAARKLGHWLEYFAFAVLLSRALQPAPKRPWDRRRSGWTLLVVFLYACGDELHQAAIPSRGGSFADVLLDFFGGLCGVLWLYLWRKSRT